MTPYELNVRGAGGNSDRVVVDLVGELDLTNAREVEQRLEELSTNGEVNLVLDVNRVVFIDSAALHVLFRTARRLGRERFGVVVDPTAIIARTLAIVGMQEVARVGSSTEEVASS